MYSVYYRYLLMSSVERRPCKTPWGGRHACCVSNPECSNTSATTPGMLRPPLRQHWECSDHHCDNTGNAPTTTATTPGMLRPPLWQHRECTTATAPYRFSDLYPIPAHYACTDCGHYCDNYYRVCSTATTAPYRSLTQSLPTARVCPRSPERWSGLDGYNVAASENPTLSIQLRTAVQYNTTQCDVMWCHLHYLICQSHAFTHNPMQSNLVDNLSQISSSLSLSCTANLTVIYSSYRLIT